MSLCHINFYSHCECKHATRRTHAHMCISLVEGAQSPLHLFKLCIHFCLGLDQSLQGLLQLQHGSSRVVWFHLSRCLGHSGADSLGISADLLQLLVRGGRHCTATVQHMCMQGLHIIYSKWLRMRAILYACTALSRRHSSHCLNTCMHCIHCMHSMHCMHCMHCMHLCTYALYVLYALYALYVLYALYGPYALYALHALYALYALYT